MMVLAPAARPPHLRAATTRWIRNGPGSRLSAAGAGRRARSAIRRAWAVPRHPAAPTRAAPRPARSPSAGWTACPRSSAGAGSRTGSRSRSATRPRTRSRPPTRSRPGSRAATRAPRRPRRSTMLVSSDRPTRASCHPEDPQQGPARDRPARLAALRRSPALEHAQLQNDSRRPTTSTIGSSASITSAPPARRARSPTNSSSSAGVSSDQDPRAPAGRRRRSARGTAHPREAGDRVRVQEPLGDQRDDRDGDRAREEGRRRRRVDAAGHDRLGHQFLAQPPGSQEERREATRQSDGDHGQEPALPGREPVAPREGQRLADRDGGGRAGNAMVGVGSGLGASIADKRSRKSTGPDRPRPHTCRMADRTLRLLVESSPKKVFVVALDWPGLARAGKTEEAAVDELLAHLGRYRPVAEAAGADLPAGDLALDVVQRVEGGGGTAFGVPSEIVNADREKVTRPRPGGRPRWSRRRGTRWTGSPRPPRTLRKGPRGGGRDTAKIVDHVNEADAAYAARWASSTTRRTARRSRRCAPRCSGSCARRPTGRRWPTAGGPRGTPLAGWLARARSRVGDRGPHGALSRLGP